MNRNLELAEDRFIERVGNLCNKFGLNNFIAQLYGVLYLSSRPLSLDELSQKLKASKGNVSINIRLLERWGAVRKVWVKGSRKDFYEVQDDIKKVLSERIRSSFNKHIGEVNIMLEEFNKLVRSSSEELTNEEKGITKTYQKRLRKIEELSGLASNAFKLAEKFL